jgi:hypothetical protein
MSGMIGTYHHAQLFYVEMESPNFALGWPGTVILLIFGWQACATLFFAIG